MTLLNSNSFSELSKEIFDNSILCAESLKEDLGKKVEIDNKEFQLKYLFIVFQFEYFFLHLTSRSAFVQLGLKKRNELVDTLSSSIIDSTIETFYGHATQKIKDEIENSFYNNLNNAENEYSACKEILLDPKDDTPSYKKFIGNEKSKSMGGQLIDNISKIITGEINLNAILEMKIWGLVFEILKTKEIDRLVLAVSDEIK
jgi:hypothetical protein